VGEEFLLKLSNVGKRRESFLESLQDAEADFRGFMRVLRLAFIAQLQVDSEEGEFDLLGSHSLDLLGGVVHVDYLRGVFDVDGEGQEIEDGVDVASDTTSGHVEEGVLHDELRLSQELLKLSLFVSLSVVLIEVEPSSSRGSDLGLSLVGTEARLDDLLDLVDPSFLEEVTCLGDATGLNLVELIHLHRLGDVGVEDILHGNFIAFLADVLLGTDHFILDLKCLAAVLRELLGEVVRGDGDHAEVRGGLLGSSLGELQLTGDEVVSFSAKMLVKDDLVHGLGEVDVDLV
jgi:hypothetical protein